MSSSTATFTLDTLEELLEELAFSWRQRGTALRDPDYTVRELNDLEHRITALLDALAQAPFNPGVAPYRELFHAGPAPVGAAAATVLAFHSALEPTIPQIHRLLQHEDPSVRITGWRLVSYLGVPLEAKTYAAAMRDEDPGVRRAAL